MKPLLIILALLAMAIPSGASIANIYYTQTASGSNNGTDCADAYAYNDATNGFNAAGKWGAGSTQIGPDTIAHACGGTFTGTAGSSLFIFQGSGTSGHPITLRGESGVDMTAPYWGGGSVGGPIWAVSRSWIVVDCPSLNCTIENTQNGDGLTYLANSYGMNINTSSNAIAKQWTVVNICQHTSLADDTGCQTSGSNDCAVCVGGGTNVTVSQMTIHDTYQGILYAPQNGDSGITLSNNTISRANWGISSGISSGTSNGLLITGNDITCIIGTTCNWDSTGDNCCHHNGIILDPQSGGVMNGVVISNNYIHDEIGESTGGIFLDPAASNEITSILIYNNVFFTTAGQQGPSNGHIACGNFVAGCQEYNNTLVGPATNGITGFATPTLYNNIVQAVGFGISLGPGYSSPASDYGDFFNIATGYAANGLAGSPYSTLASWKTATGLDTNSVTTNPNLNSDFTLPAGGTTLVGLNLTSLGIAGLDVGAPQTFGVGGVCGTGCVPRSASGNDNTWIGAYPFTSSSTVFVSPTTISFGTVTYLTTSSGMTTTVTNNSGSTITFTGTTLSGANSGDFSKSGCSSGTLINTGTCVVTLTFIPSVTPIASETASLSIAYTGFTGSPLSVSLSGTSGILTVPPAPSRAIFTISKEFKNENILFSSSFFGGYDPMWVPKENFRYSAYRSARSQ